MPPSKTERKAKLMKVAEELIDRMLAQEKAADEIMFEDIEQAAIRVGRGLQAEIVEKTVGEVRERRGIRCPTCGKRMARQGMRRRPVVSEAGEVTIQREYYYCRRCKAGSFPPG
jgi:hypothetical protein